MKSNGMISLFAVAILMVGCSDNDTVENNDTAERFTTMEKSGDTVRIDSVSKLEWIGSAGMGACSPHAAATTEMEDLASGIAHCEALVFAGHEDWRMATAAEHADFIKGMDAAGLTPFYANPACPRLIGTEGSDSAVAVNTHNSDPVGSMTPWATLLMQNATNFGIKCVRDQ